MTTELIRFAQWAKDQPQRRYTALMGLLAAEEGLADSYHRQPAGKAVGVDRTSKVDYGRELKVNLADLSARLKRMGYRPKPSRRVYIPKSSGQGQRPIGIPCFEDRIVEDRLSRILQAIWEPEFRECSYGFRPDRNAHQALSRLEHIITEERTQWLYEADLKNFFGSVSHEHMMRFIEHRIGDSNLLRLIRRFLKAGVMDEGVFSANEQGTPQGNLVSPVLSNIFLHYTLDEWFERRFARQCRGKAFLVRLADDFVACFEFEDDARAFECSLKERLQNFGLEIEPTKTALIRFGDLAPIFCKRDGLKRPRTFSFLGFTHYLRIWRNGRIVLRRKTEAVRMRRKLTEFGRRLKSMRTTGARAMQRFTLQHWQGHLQYFGVSGNSRSVSCYAHHVKRLLFKWLNRRSQRRSFTWKHFTAWLNTWMPRPGVVRRL
jgi:group II intron reverse transcriptase/maturase